MSNVARSPVAVGIVLGLVVGAGAAAAIATTGSEAGAPKTTRSTVAVGPRIVITVPKAPNTGAAPLEAQAPLPSLTGRARGYRLDAVPTAGAVERLADAMGVHGPVQS